MGNTDHSMVRDFRNNPITFEELTHCRWYAVANDTIGGWDVANVNIPDSRRDYRKGEYEIGCFLTREVAEHIAKLHNEAWDNYVWDTYHDNIIEGMLQSMLAYYGDEPIPLPDGVAPLTEDDWFDYDDPYETT